MVHGELRDEGDGGLLHEALLTALRVQNLGKDAVLEKRRRETGHPVLSGRLSRTPDDKIEKHEQVVLLFALKLFDMRKAGEGENEWPRGEMNNMKDGSRPGSMQRHSCDRGCVVKRQSFSVSDRRQQEDVFFASREFWFFE